MTEAALLEEISRMPTAEIHRIELFARQLRLSRLSSAPVGKGDRIRNRKRFRIDEDSTELIKRFRD